MKIETHQINNTRIAEIISDEVIINTVEDALELLGNVYYEDVNQIILHTKHITADFFDLKNGIAGEILQKFSNYRIRLALVGDFKHIASKSLNDFIFESNKGKQINFVDSRSEAIKALSGK